MIEENFVIDISEIVDLKCIFTHKKWYVKKTHFSNILHQHTDKRVLYKWRNNTFKVPKILLKSMGLTKDYSLAIIPRFLNLLVVPENKRNLYSLFFQTHWVHSIFETWRLCRLILNDPFFSESWCNGLLKRISFTYQKLIFWVKIYFKVFELRSSPLCVTIIWCDSWRKFVISSLERRV